MKYAALALILAATPAWAADDDAAVKNALTALERENWTAWQSHDGGYYDRTLSDDHLDIHDSGIIGKKQVAAGVAGGVCMVKSYELGEMGFTRISGDVAMLVYRASQDTHCGPAAVPSPAWVTSVYVRRDGRWQNLLYEQNAIKP